MECNICGRWFENRNQLNNHKVVHKERSIRCWGGGCDQTFKSIADMFLHLEPGYCQSRINILSVYRDAARVYQWKKFLNKEYRLDMLQRLDLEEEYYGKIYPFFCPECGAEFSKLHGLFQHASSPGGHCPQTIRGGALGALLGWLEKNYNRGRRT